MIQFLDFLSTDVTGAILLLLVLRLLWVHPNPAILTGILVACSLLVVNYGGDVPKLWHHWVPTYVTQFPPVLACLAIVVVTHRGGLGMAHKSWRYAILSLLFYFLFVSRFFASVADNDTLALHYTSQVHAEFRLWHSVFFQLIFIGGLGQVMWHVFDEKIRSVCIVVGSFAGSFLHSIIGFYGTLPYDDWLAAALGSFGPVAAIQILVGLPVLIACYRHPSTHEERLERLANATVEMVTSAEWSSLNGPAKNRSDRRGIPSA